MPEQVFLALQCAQCSTMQVKQQKKSSNKWVCAVCNQKQSVTRVFARGPLARDLRKFVQSVNMSRAAVDAGGRATGSDGHRVAEQRRGGGSEEECGRKKRRSDWSEYLDPAPSTGGGFEVDEGGGSEFEPEIVTEVPEEMLKRRTSSFPKRPLQRQRGGISREPDIVAELPKTVSEIQRLFQKHSHETRVGDGEKQSFEEDGGPRGFSQRREVETRAPSKWSEYLEEEAEQDLEFGRAHSPHLHRGGRREEGRDEQLREVRVEDEVHPDFM